jgi:hypothetical protein
MIATIARMPSRPDPARPDDVGADATNPRREQDDACERREHAKAVDGSRRRSEARRHHNRPLCSPRRFRPIAIILLVGGLISCFSGYLIFRFVLGFFGFVLGAWPARSGAGRPCG